MTTDALNQVLATVRTKLSEAWGLPTDQVTLYLAGYDRSYYAKMRTTDGTLIGMYHFTVAEKDGAPMVVMNSYKPGLTNIFTVGWSAVSKANDALAEVVS